jgi:hypothetical protein
VSLIITANSCDVVLAGCSDAYEALGLQATGLSALRKRYGITAWPARPLQKLGDMAKGYVL